MVRGGGDLLMWRDNQHGAWDAWWAFGWAYVNNLHNTWDQFYVYWICPFAGAILAAWIFRAIFPPPEVKQKKSTKKQE
ncbi:aquaporin sip1-2-like protein [Trifolium pratense]|uniref:Aquaporin sip1-2-like protein n=1 Tax=Trifolium pratense TaxID=57577 RepID=A0A2K3NWJ5_TRIPR|nr:aquaporin sip1-2-like protein [Trifolium pratense]